MPFLETTFGKLLMTFGTAMVPVIELRGAIPVGIAAGLPPAVACVIAILGNLLPVPFIMLLTRRVFNWLERRAHLKGRIVRKYRLAGLFVLVAIPLPGTGAWTGALVASLLDIRLRTALPAILLGLVVAGGITTAVTMGVVHLF